MDIDFKKIESKWQKKWEQAKCFEVEADNKKKKFYCLEMFPYPSAAGLHMGHALNYSIGDVFARFKRMNGFNVMYPMGFDALGLPAENAAIKAGEHPKPFTQNAIKNYIRQMKEIGLSYDWSKIVSTMSHEYYKWNQFFFLKFLEKGLVYRKKAPVNWCPKCNTVLANEQVQGGRCWRHEDTEVEIKHLEQWFMKTTNYADELLDKLDDLDWPDKIKSMQRNWIGKSYGTEIDFEVETPDSEGIKGKEFIFIHGYKFGIEDDFWKWLEKEIISRGGKIVFNKTLPNKTVPNLEEQMNFVLDNCKFNENSILVSHSLGNVLAMKLLPEIKNKIQKWILVAPPLDKNKRKDGKPRPKNLQNYSDWNFDFNILKNKAKEIFVLADKNDHIIPKEQPEEISKKLNAEFILTEAKNTHFNSKEEPSIIEVLSNSQKTKFPIFTTRPDTIYGVTFMVISAQHERLMDFVTDEQKKEVENFLKKLRSVSEKEMEDLEKEGVFTGSYAINPVNNERVPIYAGNFVVADYGSGMVMAVPAHCVRDYDFAEKYGLEIREVIKGGSPKDIDKSKIEKFSGELINSEKFNGMNNREAINEITKFLIKKGIGRETVNYKLRDWGFSRQRYWGTPIPIIVCEKCKKEIEEKSFVLKFYDQNNFNDIKNGIKAIETRAINFEEDEKRFYAKVKKGNTLKIVNEITKEIIYVEVENVKKFKNLESAFEDKVFISKFSDKIKSIKDLEKIYSFEKDYINRINKNGLVSWDIKLIIPGRVPVPEKDLPVELPEKVKFGEGNPLLTNEKWLNVKCPKCGRSAKREADTMDTFFDSSWYYLRYADNKNSKNPFDKKNIDYWLPVDQYIGGAEHACMHLIYARFFTKALRDLGYLNFDEPFTSLFNQGMLHGEDGDKMSKSKGNVINPDEVSKKYGMDTARLFLLSLALPDKPRDWSEAGINGSLKFVKKIFEKFDKIKIGKSNPKIESKLNKAIKEVTNQIESFKYNLAIIKVRDLFNSLGEEESKEVLEKSLKLLSPFCPHIAEELWEKLGNAKNPQVDFGATESKTASSRRQQQDSVGKNFISLSEWPKVEEKKIDESLDKQDDMVKKLNLDIENIKKLTGKDDAKVYVYVLPNEIEIYKNVKGINLFVVNDKKKYDPENKSKKVKPGKPGVYLE